RVTFAGARRSAASAVGVCVDARAGTPARRAPTAPLSDFAKPLRSSAICVPLWRVIIAQLTGLLTLLGLRDVPESAGPPDDIIAYLRNLPPSVCLHKFGRDHTARDKIVFWIVRAGVTALPHVHRDDIDTHGRLIAVDEDIVPGQEMLRSFKTSEAFLVAGADVF